jgi:hypothetical protein
MAFCSIRVRGGFLWSSLLPWPVVRRYREDLGLRRFGGLLCLIRLLGCPCAAGMELGRLCCWVIGVWGGRDFCRYICDFV